VRPLVPEVERRGQHLDVGELPELVDLTVGAGRVVDHHEVERGVDPGVPAIVGDLLADLEEGRRVVEHRAEHPERHDGPRRATTCRQATNAGDGWWLR